MEQALQATETTQIKRSKNLKYTSLFITRELVYIQAHSILYATFLLIALLNIEYQSSIDFLRPLYRLAHNYILRVGRQFGFGMQFIIIGL